MNATIICGKGRRGRRPLQSRNPNASITSSFLALYFLNHLAFFRKMCYNILKQKNKHGSLGYFYSIVERCTPLGDKEIAVKFRGNSHYRN